MKKVIASILLALATAPVFAATTIKIMFVYDDGARADERYLNAVVQHAETRFTHSGIDIDLQFLKQVSHKQAHIVWYCERGYSSDLAYPVVDKQLSDFNDLDWRGAHLIYFTYTESTEIQVCGETSTVGGSASRGSFGQLKLYGDPHQESITLAHEIGHNAGVQHADAVMRPRSVILGDGKPYEHCVSTIMVGSETSRERCKLLPTYRVAIFGGQLARYPNPVDKDHWHEAHSHPIRATKIILEWLDSIRRSGQTVSASLSWTVDNSIAVP